MERWLMKQIKKIDIKFNNRHYMVRNWFMQI